jgi:hypothetical protein
MTLQLHSNRPRQSKLTPDFGFRQSGVFVCSFKMTIHPTIDRTHNVTLVIERDQCSQRGIARRYDPIYDPI